MKRNSSWRREAVREAERWELGEHGRREFGPVPVAPWELRGWSRCTVATDLAGVEGRGAAAEVLRAEAEEAVGRWKGEFVVFTDGSLFPDKCVGGSAAIATSGPPDRVAVTAGRAVCLVGASSSFEVEVRALLLAAGLLGDLSGSGRVVLCSDSRSALDCLRLPTGGEPHEVSDLRARLSRVARKVVLQWVPGHCGLPGNEAADRVAKAAAEVGAVAGTTGLGEAFVECLGGGCDGGD